MKQSEASAKLIQLRNRQARVFCPVICASCNDRCISLYEGCIRNYAKTDNIDNEWIPIAPHCTYGIKIANNKLLKNDRSE